MTVRTEALTENTLGDEVIRLGWEDKASKRLYVAQDVALIAYRIIGSQAAVIVDPDLNDGEWEIRDLAEQDPA